VFAEESFAVGNFESIL